MDVLFDSLQHWWFLVCWLVSATSSKGYAGSDSSYVLGIWPLPSSGLGPGLKPDSVVSGSLSTDSTILNRVRCKATDCKASSGDRF